jgi:hypothetical protein
VTMGGWSRPVWKGKPVDDDVPTAVQEPSTKNAKANRLAETFSRP